VEGVQRPQRLTWKWSTGPLDYLIRDSQPVPLQRCSIECCPQVSGYGLGELTGILGSDQDSVALDKGQVGGDHELRCCERLSQ